MPTRAPAYIRAVGERRPKSVTRIHPVIPRVAAVVVPISAAILLAFGGRSVAELTLLWGAVVLLLLAVSAILSSMLWNGRFPPRISTQGSDLPDEGVGETGAALELFEASLREIGERVRRIESHIGIDK
jgi:hypothetical protein